MRGLTFDEIRDQVHARLAQIFPDVDILDVGSHSAFRGQDFIQIEPPVVTYALRFTPNFRRVVDEWTTKDLMNYTATIEELIPYDVILHIGCHSDLMKEAEDLALRLLRGLGRAPCIGEIGFHLVDTSYTGAFDLTGIYSYGFRYEGWVRLPGPVQTAPLIREIHWQATIPDETLGEQLGDSQVQPENRETMIDPV
jgi:hypothetical protein